MIKEIGEKTGFPKEAIDFLEETFKKIIGDFENFNDLCKAQDDFYCEEDKKYLEILEGISKKSGIHRFTVDIIFLLFSAKPLYYIYKQQNLSEELYWETMNDLKYKMMECRNVYGIWGTFVIEWAQKFYTCERFKLGRLQYEKAVFECDENKKVIKIGNLIYDTHIPENYKGIIKSGDKVYNCHIPSSGPLNRDDVIDSIKKAYEFYKDEIKDGVMPIICDSWLLYPPHYEVYPENSNLRGFYELFDIVESVKKENNPDAWRVFNKTGDDYENMPEETRLQKRFKKYLAEGNTMGNGFGIILFDGEKIINK